MAAPTCAPVLVLHAHTTMSMLDGASPVEDYIAYAKANSHSICACTDHGWLSGIFDLVTKSAKAGIKPSPGCEFYLKPHADHKFVGKPYDYFHLTVWAYNQAGFRNLVELGSKSWAEGKPITKWGKSKPRVTWEDLGDHSDGLIVGSGCIEGPIGKCLLHGEDEQAWINARMLKEIFGERLFFELMPATVDRDYVKGESVLVRGENDITYRFLPDDVLVTDEGDMTAAEALMKRPREVLLVRPTRVQDGPLMDKLPMQSMGEIEVVDESYRPFIPLIPAEIYESKD